MRREFFSQNRFYKFLGSTLLDFVMQIGSLPVEVENGWIQIVFDANLTSTSRSEQMMDSICFRCKSDFY